MKEQLLAIGVNALVRTLRVNWEGERLPPRSVIAFWHSKMLAGWWLSKSHAVAMVSKSNDGEYLSAILAKWQYEVVRGSSGKGGMQALEEAMNKIEYGERDQLVITPDGPRGPVEVFKRGAFIAAKKLDVPLIFLDIHYHSRIVLQSSWDRFEIPYPFSRVDIRPYTINTRGFPDAKAEQDAFLAVQSRAFQTPAPIPEFEPVLGA